MSEVLALFPTAVHISQYENDMTEELKFIKNLEYKPNGPTSDPFTAPNGNYRTTSISVLKEKELKNISIFIQKQLDYYTKEIMLTDDKLIPTISWCNRNPQGSKHHEHRHANSIISGVFYFAINKSAPIQFSKGPVGEYQFNFKKWNDFNSSIFVVEMRVGELILFPSNTNHSVHVNKESEERISLGFNTFSTSLGNDLTRLNLRDLKQI